jgi:Ca-activated chloride channel family protein
MPKKLDFYAILGLARDASPEEIHKAYLNAARQLHPDKNLAPGDTELFLGAQEAYEVLSNPKKRAKYDSSLPPEKIPESVLEQTILFSRENLLHLYEPQILYVLMEFTVPPGVKVRSTPPVNFCLVLDRSTSMQGVKMDVVKATAIEIMRKLKPDDIFSVVAFSDRAEVLIPANRNFDQGRDEARIQMLQPSGGTEVYSGLELGYNEVIRNVGRTQVNHIILLTDGRTYGDEDKCKDLAQKASEQGIGISGIGIGSEWNDNFLDELASITGGTSKYIAQPQDIQHALLDKFNQLGNEYAEEVRLEFEKVDNVELRYAFRLQPDAGLLSFESPLMLGPIIWDNYLKIIMEFVIQPEAVSNSVANIFKGKVDVTLVGNPSLKKPITIDLVRPVRNDAYAEPPPLEIVEALSRLKLYRLQEQARLEVTAGNYDQAVEQLTRLATHLLSQGERDLAKTALIEAENIQREKSFSQQGGKEIKYGTRALLMSGRHEEEQ